MGRENLVSTLVSEAYAATHWDDAKFRPLDPRRVKRLASIMTGSRHDDTETLNRLAGAHAASCEHRLAQRNQPHD